MLQNKINISVCLASCNGEKYITEQVTTILDQLKPSDELIISDDSSSDDTQIIIESFQKHDSRIIFLSNNTFHNPVYNFENALKHAKGEIIFLADQDDIWLPGKVDNMLNLLKTNLLVTHDAKVIDSEMNLLHKSYLSFRRAESGFWKNIFKNSYSGCCMAFHRTLLENALPFPKNLAYHDQWLGLLAEIYGKTLFLYEPLILFRRHGNNISPGLDTKKNSLLTKLINRLVILKQIIFRLLLKK